MLGWHNTFMILKHGIPCGLPACIMQPTATLVNYACTIKITQ